MNRDSIVVINGTVFNLSEAKISVLDRGFLYADSVFEVMVGFHDKVLDVLLHLQRLRESAACLDISIPWTDEELSFEINTFSQLITAFKKYIRLVITRGQSDNIGLYPSDSLKPNKILYICKAPQDYDWVYSIGGSLKTNIVPYNNKIFFAKTIDYYYTAVALKKVKQQGFFDVLFVNDKGEIKESSIANIFFVERFNTDINIVTPPLDSGILKGITRMNIINICKNYGFNILEQKIYINELARFDECFLTSTVRGLIPITQIDNHRIYTNRPNSVFNTINKLFLENVWEKLGFKIKWISGEKIS